MRERQKSAGLLVLTVTVAFLMCVCLSAAALEIDREMAAAQKLVDSGSYLLESLDQPEKALEAYRQALELVPDFAPAFVFSGIAYERLGKCGLARAAYERAGESSPNQAWAGFARAYLRGLDLSFEGAFVTEWYAVGPFRKREPAGLSPSDTIRLGAVYEALEGSVGWQRVSTPSASGYVNLNTLFSPNDFVSAYALTYAYSAEQRTLELRIGSDDGIEVWVNGRSVFNSKFARRAMPDDNIVSVPFQKGWNPVLLKVTDTEGSWGFYFRVTDQQGHLVADLVFDPDRNTGQALRTIQAVRKKQYLHLGLRVLLGLVLGILLLGSLGLGIAAFVQRIRTKRMQERFVFGVSHELKTPLAAIGLLTTTLQSGRLENPEKAQQYFGLILSQVRRLSCFIDNVLNFARMKQGRFPFDFQTEELAAIARESVELFRSQHPDRVPETHTALPSEPVPVHVDREALLHVLLNLLNNALQYSDSDQPIDMHLRKHNQWAMISVTDHGIGIPKKELKLIFDDFYRGHTGSKHWAKGSGLGLALARYIVEAHQGTITAQSTLQKGSTFTIRLPLAEGEHPDGNNPGC